MEKLQEKKQKSYASLMIAMFFFVLSVILMAAGYYRKLDARLFEERKTYLLAFADQVTENVDMTVDTTWKELDACEYILKNDRFQLQNEQQLMDELVSMEAFIDTDTMLLLVLDDKGNYYSSDGQTGYWQESGLTDIFGDGRRQSIMQIPHVENDDFLVLSQYIDETVLLQENGKRLTHIAIAIKSESIKNQLSVGGFGEESCACIVNEDGQCLYPYTYENDFIDGDNLFRSLANYEVLHGESFEILERAVQQGESAVLEFVYADEETQTSRDWFVTNFNIEGIDWQVLFFVPTDVLGADTSDLIYEMTRFCFIVMAAMMLALLLLIISKIADKKRIRQKEATNVILREAAGQANRASLAKGDVLLRISHDIRAPIDTIMGMTGIAAENINDPDCVTECLSKIERAAHRLFSLVNDMPDMGRIESGKVRTDIGSTKESLEKEDAAVTPDGNGKIVVDLYGKSESVYFDSIDAGIPVLDDHAAAAAVRALEREDANTVPVIIMTHNVCNEEMQKDKEEKNAYLS
jgi:hypothetical protein